MKKIVTIKDVAKKANVSVATISRTLNNDKNVSDKTREHVLEVIKELGYTPNVLGRNLRVSKTNCILVILPDMANTFYGEVIRGIDDIAVKNGYMTMISTTRSILDIENKYVSQLFNHSFDGMILASTEQSADDLSINSKRAPMVMCCEMKDGARISAVTINNRKAQFDAVEHLIRCGHRKIALITSVYSYSSNERTKGYFDALSRYNIPVNENYIIYGGYSYSDGFASASRLMSLNNPPTAICAISDILAVAVNNLLINIGMRPGKDVDVFGFDHTPVSQMASPQFNTVAQPAYDIGKSAMELLIKKMKNIDSEEELILLPHGLVTKNFHKVR